MKSAALLCYMFGSALFFVSVVFGQCKASSVCQLIGSALFFYGSLILWFA